MMELKEKICFVVNPVSGSDISKRKKKKLPNVIRDFLDFSKYDYKICLTEYQGHGEVLATQAVKEGYRFIIAVGGDGTVNEVARRLINTESIMGVIPSGSGNGLARHLQIPLDFKGAIEVINQGHIISIDTGTIGDSSGQNNKEQVFVSSCGVGFDAHMASKFAELKQRGLWGYIKAIYREYFTYQPGNYLLTMNGEAFNEVAMLITVANSSQYGNNAVISPGAQLDDGLLDVCVVKPFPLYALPGMVLRLFSNSLDKSRYVQIYNSAELEIRGNSSNAQFDGDYLDLTPNVKIRVIPNSLNLIAPKK